MVAMQISNRALSILPTPITSLSTGRALVPYSQVTDVAKINTPENDVADPYHSLNGEAASLLFSRHASPSELTEVSLDLYAMGLLSFEDYSALANHPEINPNYNRTIGALTGEPAAPERKRDLVVEWEEKYQFLTRNSPKNESLINQAARITNLLRALARKTNLHV